MAERADEGLGAVPRDHRSCRSHIVRAYQELSPSDEGYLIWPANPVHGYSSRQDLVGTLAPPRLGCMDRSVNGSRGRTVEPYAIACPVCRQGPFCRWCTRIHTGKAR